MPETSTSVTPTAVAPASESNEAVLREAISVIDKALSVMMNRELVSSNEVTDVLLDVRTLLTVQQN
ncbi:MAG TPA: hypothetical protein PKV27_05540 [Ilumatobacteraceae bacterium]|nr:hypothetical protein [Ilumatobacteraceae bacterium]